MRAWGAGGRTRSRALAVAAALALPLAAAPAADALPVPSAADIRAYSDEIAAAWVPQVGPGGEVADPAPQPRTAAYGNEMLGYAMLRRYARTGDRAAKLAGLRALLYPANTTVTNPFTLWALTEAFAWADRNLAGDAEWLPARARLVDFLSGLTGTIGRCVPPQPCVTNWTLIDAQAKLALLHLGLPGKPGSLIARGAEVKRDARELLGERMRHSAPAAGTSNWTNGPVQVLSDPGDEPLAYHAFSLVQLQHVREDDPDLFPAKNWTLVDEMAELLGAMTAPDGQVAWYGRSFDESFALAAALRGAAGELYSGFLSSSRAGGVLAQTWQRLLERHGRVPGSGVIAVVPALRQRLTYAGIDAYAGLAVYNGLTLLLLEEAADLLDRIIVPRNGEAASARRDGVLIDRRGSGVVALRRDRVWIGVATRTTDLRRFARDPRYRVGLNVLQVRDGRGRWRSVLPAPPPTGESLPAMPVPVVEGRACEPSITAVRVVGGARLSLRGRWRCGRQRPRLDVGLRPSGGGVTVTIAARRGWKLRGALDVPGDARGQATGARWPTGRITVPAGATVAPLEPLAAPSSSHAELRRLRWSLPVRRDRTVAMRVAAG
ncbi:hypothetical protein [Patulibacter defluvii]|uniref:hypothetical protein n=1 Tax=Patulibacter defluvii TaxID=3095358 RepID=UPI002A75B810|nr:hypothetical protein [Patulibacter sp. DM4]